MPSHLCRGDSRAEPRAREVEQDPLGDVWEIRHDNVAFSHAPALKPTGKPKGRVVQLGP